MHISRWDTPSSITACISWLKVHLRQREDCLSSLLRTECASHLSFDGPSFFLVAVLFRLIDTVPSSSRHSRSTLTGFSSDPSTSSSPPGPLQPPSLRTWWLGTAPVSHRCCNRGRGSSGGLVNPFLAGRLQPCKQTRREGIRGN